MLKNVTNTSMLGSLFFQEKEAFSGVNKIARKVMHDVKLVFGYAPQAYPKGKKPANGYLGPTETYYVGK